VAVPSSAVQASGEDDGVPRAWVRAPSEARRPSYAQMFTDVGVYYAPAAVLRGEEFNGAEAVHRLEQWLIENHGYQPQYAVSELSERDFWRMFDASHYEHCRRKYGAVGTLMSVYYKSKKGKKTEKEV